MIVVWIQAKELQIINHDCEIYSSKPVGPINSRILMNRKMIRMPTMNLKILGAKLQIVTVMMLISIMVVKLLDKISLNIQKAKWSRLRRPGRHLPAQVPHQFWPTPRPWPMVLLMIHLQQQVFAWTSAS